MAALAACFRSARFGRGRMMAEPARRWGHTVFALATGAPPTAISVVRISGAAAHPTLQSMLRNQPFPATGKAALRALFPPTDSSPGCAAQPDARPLDTAMVVAWKAPRSYTGEDLVELQLHGGPAVVSAVSAALGAVDGVRPAVEGEFTRRALANGKLDLTQVEGVYDLITAETEAQRDQAVRHLTAETTELYDRWRAEILRAMAHVEAYIDFGEDEGLEDEVMQQAVAQVTGLRAEIAGYIARTRCGERLRRGVRVAVVGRPNVGKSSLMNFLCGRDAAIVADSPGTTRDVIEVAGDVGGYPVLFLDTAGVRHLPGIDPVEVEGILRGEAAAARADLRICVQDSVAGAAGLCERGWSRGGAPCQCQPDGPPTAPIIVVHNKMDLVLSSEAEARERGGGVGAVAVSCLRGTGLDALVDRLRHEVQALCGGGASALPLIQARHKRHLLDCVQGLDRVLSEPDDVVVAAEELRVAAEQFGHITGRFETERVLDVIFAEFCIGK